MAGLIVGPGDLGLRIGKSNIDLIVDKAMQRTAEAAKKHGKAWGCPAANPERVRELREMGAQLIAYGGDFGAFMEMLKNRSSELDELYGT